MTDGRYDTGGMERPAPEEISRALKALALGAVLGALLRLLSHDRPTR